MAKTVFDYINSINNKNYHWDSNSEKEFNSYIAISAFGYYIGTLFFANEINQFQNMSKKQVYDFLYYSIEKKRRWSSWIKQDKKERDFLLEIAQYYKTSIINAKSLIALLNDEEVKKLKENLKGKGGRE